MMITENMIKKNQYEKTEHGMINYSHDMGTAYVTHRRPEHFFKKYGGFAVSESEIQIAMDKKAFWIMIIYHGKNNSTPYRMRMGDLQYMEVYDNDGDKQRVIPLRSMEERKIGGWE